ncbi:glucosamine-6-phosphate deaminase [Kineosporia babensis]|uniref:Glucosamine-6-phosphate deaminase n=1 Tax=Kineosporia babensis TaxID=499548 RepID=A0A9X1NHN4_9ACTN|nr:glucosamine-6-phosphate deaminase [Kineosporia babensis]MCD5313951.1 glucosamine-6-phosphate deaminase [Kineosporia babensis]
MGQPQIITAPDRQAVGREAARVVEAALTAGELSTLGVATGSSPLPLYRALAASRPEGLSEIAAFALDEYVGLDPQHPESYRQVVRREVTEPLGLDPHKVRVPDGAAENPALAARMYEEQIAASGGIDLQILGIGGNGHIAFNEPGSERISLTRVVDLTPATRIDNSRFFDHPDEVPRQAITQGVATILRARRLLLVVHGPTKSGLLRRAFEGPVTPDFPASFLQSHPQVTVVADQVSAQGLSTILAPAAR